MDKQINKQSQYDCGWLEDYTAEFYSESFWEYIVTIAEELAKASSEA
ncbi:MAG: hypothetical protein NC293_10605 [Roseburia sp.]|nr:hypothetical protein [Roseburia sp.]